jgi:hypothetical protein
MKHEGDDHDDDHDYDQSEAGHARIVAFQGCPSGHWIFGGKPSVIVRFAC